jgi:hypothetical protein
MASISASAAPVVDVQRRAAAAVAASAAPMRAAPSSVVAVPITFSRARPVLRDGGADAARGAGHQGHLAGHGRVCHVMVSFRPEAS